MKLGLVYSLMVSVLSWLIFSSSAAFAKPANVITHVVLEDETAWFLASVYYGNGTSFPKLLTSNHLTRPEDMKVGMEIRVEEPKFHKEQASFAARYAKLWEGRQKALGLKIGSSLPNAKVVIPTETIRSQDSLQKLPFTEVQNPQHVSGHEE